MQTRQVFWLAKPISSIVNERTREKNLNEQTTFRSPRNYSYGVSDRYEYRYVYVAVLNKRSITNQEITMTWLLGRVNSKLAHLGRSTIKYLSTFFTTKSFQTSCRDMTVVSCIIREFRSRRPELANAHGLMHPCIVYHFQLTILFSHSLQHCYRQNVFH